MGINDFCAKNYNLAYLSKFENKLGLSRNESKKKSDTYNVHLSSINIYNLSYQLETVKLVMMKL